MTQPVLVKVYGNLFPSSQEMFLSLKKSCKFAMPATPSPLSLKKDLLLLSFEGIFFPVDDFISVLEDLLMPDLNGKVNYLDIENWQMTRYLIGNGQIQKNNVSLNHVMDYSGF